MWRMEELLKQLFDEKTIKIISYLQNKKTLQIREAARQTSISVSTVFRIFKKLEKIDLLKGKKIGAIKTYKVNQKSKFYTLIEKIVPKMKPLEFFTKKIVSENIEEILLLDKGEDKASIMIIGEISGEKYQKVTETIKKDFDFSIKVLVLSKDQYENLASLNMKPTPKKVLYQK